MMIESKNSNSIPLQMCYNNNLLNKRKTKPFFPPRLAFIAQPERYVDRSEPAKTLAVLFSAN